MYLDSCILVKLLVVEPDSESFVLALAGQSLVTSELAYTEIYSALCACERAGRISGADLRRAWREFGQRIANEEIHLLPLNSVTLRKAAQLLAYCHAHVPLRSLDAIHLAAVDLCQDFPLATTDARLRAAAQRMRFDLFPPVEEPPAP
jgi:predicted nucleic acid-binding protein